LDFGLLIKALKCSDIAKSKIVSAARRYTSIDKNNYILLLKKECTLMHSPEEEATAAGAGSTWRLMSAQ
jgi:hypothetical protein